MPNTPGTALVSTHEYQKFPDTPFLDSEPKSNLFKRTIVDSQSIHEEYLQVETANQAIGFYEKILLHLLGPRSSRKGLLGFREFFNDSSELDLGKGKIIREYDAIILLMENILDDLDQKFDLNASKKKQDYLKKKEEILEGEKREEEKPEEGKKIRKDPKPIDAPDLPIPYVDRTPAVREARSGFAEKFGGLLSLSHSIDWDEFQDQMNNFSKDMKGAMYEVITYLEENSKDESTESFTPDEQIRYIRERFEEVKAQYSFPRGFDINIDPNIKTIGEDYVVEPIVFRDTITYKDDPDDFSKSYVVPLGKEIIIRIAFTLPSKLPKGMQQLYRRRFRGEMRDDIIYCPNLEETRGSFADRLFPEIAEVGRIFDKRKAVTVKLDKISKHPIIKELFKGRSTDYNVSDERVEELEYALDFFLQKDVQKFIERAAGMIGRQNLPHISVNAYQDPDAFFKTVQETVKKHVHIPEELRNNWDGVCEELSYMFKTDKPQQYELSSDKDPHTIGIKRLSENPEVNWEKIEVKRTEDSAFIIISVSPSSSYIEGRDFFLSLLKKDIGFASKK